MNLKVWFDQSVSTLPASFVAAVNYVVNYFDSLFTENVTINIDLGYGEIDGQPLAGNALGESEPNLASASYLQTVGTLQTKDQLGSSTLPGSSPFNDGTLWLTTAQERAIGLLPGNSGEVDGWVGISNTAPFSFSANTTPAAGQYYLIGVLEHEFTEIMGRISFISADIGATGSYSVMDLYRFSSSGVHQLGTSSPAYFSIDNGDTNLGNWNTNPGGDLGDWAASAGPDAFLAFSPPGQIQNMSASRSYPNECHRLEHQRSDGLCHGYPSYSGRSVNVWCGRNSDRGQQARHSVSTCANCKRHPEWIEPASLRM